MVCKHIDPPIESSESVLCAAAEANLWVSEVKDRSVVRQCVQVDEVLSPERPLLADLRYVRLLVLAQKVDASSILKMKEERKRKQHDLERPYHPLLLTMLQVRPPHCLALQVSLGNKQASMHLWQVRSEHPMPE